MQVVQKLVGSRTSAWCRIMYIALVISTGGLIWMFQHFILESAVWIMMRSFLGAAQYVQAKVADRYGICAATASVISIEMSVLQPCLHQGVTGWRK